MNLAMLLVGAAMAGRWSPPVPLEAALQADGTLLLPAGEAIRLILSPPGSLPEVRSDDGAAVALRGEPDGVLIPEAGASRSLTVRLPEGVSARVRTEDGRGEVARWRDLDSGARTGPLPWGLGQLTASLRILDQAIASPDVRALARAGLLSAVQPPSRATHRPLTPRSAPLDAAHPWTIPLRGPAMALITAQPGAGGFQRFELSWSLDGEPVGAVRMGASSEARRGVRAWIPPGPHELAISTSSAGLDVVVSPWIWRRAVQGGVPWRSQPESGLDEAERLYWMGQRSAANVVFSDVAQATGLTESQRALVLARLIQTSGNPAALVPRADQLAALSEDGRAVVASAILQRADQIPPSIVLSALGDPGRLDPGALAAWLDGLGGTRARGVALLLEASADASGGPALGAVAVREESARTRFTGLLPDLPELRPDALAEVPGGRREVLTRLGAPAWSLEGSGVPRAVLAAGQTVSLNLPSRPGGRYPVLRLEGYPSGAPVRYSLDGRELTAPRGGSLDISIDSGPHELGVREGSLLLLDPETITGGEAARVVERLTFALPAPWAIPDPGYEADLRITVQASGGGAPPELWARLDSGRALALHPDARGVASLTVLPFETRLELDGPPGTRAAVEIRTAAPPAPAPEARAAPSADDSLEALRALSEQLDRARGAGDIAEAASLRLLRAESLLALGQLDRARRDLAGVLQADPAADPRLSRIQAAAREDWEGTSPEIPSASHLGPQTPEAALVWAGLDVLFDAEDPIARALALEDAATRLDARSPGSGDPLWRVAASTWVGQDRVLEALRAALQAGPDAGPLIERLLGRLGWAPLTRADSGAGLVSVHVQPAPPAPDTLGAAVTDALLASPWPGSERVALRADQRDRVLLAGGTLELGLYCRDERGPGTPCRARIRRDQDSEVLNLEDGAPPTRWTWTSPPGGGPYEVEISGVEPGHVILVRAQLDGALLPPGVDRLALRATPRQPIGLQLAGPGVLRVEASRGEVRVALRAPPGARTPAPKTASPGQQAWIPLVEAGIWNVDIEGDGDVFLALGQPEQQPASVDWAPPPLAPAPLLPPEALEPIFDAWAAPAPEPDIDAGSGGTLRARLDLRRDAVYRPTEPWSAADLDLAWLRREARWWTWIDGWGGGPRPSAGASAQLGRPLWQGWIAASAQGGYSSGLAGGAGHALGALTLRQEPGREDHDLWARLEARIRAEWSSQAPRAPVDPLAWTAWGEEHPLTLTLRASALAQPSLDSRASLGLSATSNSPGGGGPLDQIRASGSFSLLLASRGVLSLDASEALLLADADRQTTRAVTAFDLRQDWAWWSSDRLRLRVFGQLSAHPEPGWLRAMGVEGLLGVELMESAHRGLRDLPPGAEAFSTLRERR